MAGYRRRHRTVYGRKSLGKKRQWRKKFARKSYMSRSLSTTQPVHYYTRHVDKGTISGDGVGTDTFGVLYFKLEDVPGYSEFVNMYRAYKICAVKVTFIPISNVTVYGSVSVETFTTNYHRLVTVFDYMNSSTPTSLSELREYHNCKVTGNNRLHKRFIYPKVQLAIDQDAQGGSALTYGELKQKPWLVTSSSTSEYLGIKYGFEQSSSSSDPRYRIECKYYLAFKQPK